MLENVWLAVALAWKSQWYLAGIGDNCEHHGWDLNESSRDKSAGTLIETVLQGFKVLKAIPIINENSFMMSKTISTNLNIYAQSSL